MEMFDKILSVLIDVAAWLFGALNKSSSLIFSAFALVVILLYFWLFFLDFIGTNPCSHWSFALQ